MFEVVVIHYPYDEDTYFVCVMDPEGRPVSEIIEVNDPKRLNKAVTHATMVKNQKTREATRAVPVTVQ